jgi:protein-tyrosine phosphatase
MEAGRCPTQPSPPVHPPLAGWPDSVRTLRAMPVMPVLTRERRICVPGAFNLRDLGGYAASDGHRVRWQLVYRADGLHRIPARSPSLVAELGWRTVIDLRTISEVEAGGFRGDGAEVVNLPMLRRTWGIPTEPVTDPVEFLASHYLEMLDQGATAISTAFAILGSPVRLPAVFHCSAGKDRTGVLAALLLSALGVPDEAVAADYHLSAGAIEQLLAWLKASRPDLAEEMLHQPRALLGSPPEAMFAFLARLRHRFGSVGGYLGGIGVGQTEISRLRQVLLEPPNG